MEILLTCLAIAIFMAFEICFCGHIAVQTFRTENKALAIFPAGATVFLTLLTRFVLNTFTGGVS